MLRILFGRCFSIYPSWKFSSKHEKERQFDDQSSPEVSGNWKSLTHLKTSLYLDQGIRKRSPLSKRTKTEFLVVWFLRIPARFSCFPVQQNSDPKKRGRGTKRVSSINASASSNSLIERERIWKPLLFNLPNEKRAILSMIRNTLSLH